MCVVHVVVYHAARAVRHAWDWCMGPEPVEPGACPARVTVYRGGTDDQA